MSNLYLVQDADWPQYVLADSWQSAVDAWKTRVAADNEMPFLEVAEPDGIYHIADCDTWFDGRQGAEKVEGSYWVAFSTMDDDFGARAAIFESRFCALYAALSWLKERIGDTADGQEIFTQWNNLHQWTHVMLDDALNAANELIGGTEWVCVVEVDARAHG